MRFTAASLGHRPVAMCRHLHCVDGTISFDISSLQFAFMEMDHSFLGGGRELRSNWVYGI